MKDSRFHVGDKVLIVAVENCAFGYNEYMEELIGSKTEIKRVYWNDAYDCYEYKIHDDLKGPWSYDDSCFEPYIPIELPEFSASEQDLFSLFV